MAKSNGFNSMFSVEFEGFDSVKKKLDILTNQINKQAGDNIKLNVDTSEITKIIGNLSNLARQDIQILPDGQITTISKFNAELGKTITLKQNLSKNETTIGISDDEEKRLREYAKLFDQAIQQENKLNSERQKSRDVEWKEMETQYKEEQQFINSSQTLKQKASQQSRANAEAEAKISNKILEEQYKQNQAQEKELLDAQKLIAYEKQKLELRLKNVNANRGSLVSQPYSNSISDGITNLSGKTVDEVRAKTKALNLEISKLDQNARMQGLQVGNKNIMSFGESVKSTATKLGIFASTAMVLSQVGIQFKSAINYVVELDSAMISLKKVTSETNETYNKFLKDMHNVALQFGTQSNLMVDAVTNWSKTGKSLQEASKLAESTILLTKVGDVSNVDLAQTYMLPALKAFNIEAENSIELINEYNNISNNMATTVNDVGSAMSKSASSMSVAGNSLEETIALIATAESTTKLGGDAIGQAMKSLSMRLATFKDDETGEIIPKMAESIKELSGVSVTDLNGQLKNTYDIYMEIGKVYKDLDKNSQMQLNEILGGKLRGNVVSAILTNTDELQRAFDLASNSAGSAMKEFETYQESIQYSIDRLKEQVNGLYTSFVNSGFLKAVTEGSADAIGIIKKMVDGFGVLPTVITTVVGALTLFNTKFRETTQMMLNFSPTLNKVFTSLNGLSTRLQVTANGYKDQIAKLRALTLEYQKAGLSTTGLGKNLGKLNIDLALTTTKMIATKVATIALQMALTMGLSLGISAIISGITSLTTHLLTATKTMDSCSEQAKTLSESLNDIDSGKDLVSEYEKLNNKLKDTTLSADQIKTLNEQITQVKAQLGADDSYFWILNDETKTLEQQLELMKQIQAKKVEDEAKDLNKNMVSQTGINQNASQLESDAEEWKILTEAINNADEKGRTTYKGFGDSADNLKVKLAQVEERIKANSLEVEKYNSSLNLIEQAGLDTSRTQVELSNSVLGATNEINGQTKAIEENTNAKNSNSNVDTGSGDTSNQQSSINALSETYKQLGYSVEDTAKKIEDLNEMTLEDKSSQIVKDATTAYGNSIKEVETLTGLINDLNESQAMTPDLVMTLASKYPEIGYRINDVASVQEFLNSKISEQVDAQAEAYRIMNENDNTYYNSKILNNEELRKNFESLCANFVDEHGNAYKIDLSNFTNLAQLKAKLTDDLGEGVANFITSFVRSNADGYSVDLANTSSYASSKAKILSQLNTQIKKLESNMASALSKIKSDAYTGMKAGDIEAEKLYIMASNQLEDAKAQYEEIQTDFSNYSSNFSGYTPTFNSGNFTGGGSSGSSGSSSGGSSSTAKDVADLEIKTQRYYDLENAIEKVNNALDINNILSKNATDDKKLDYIKEEIKLYNQKREALEKLQAEQKKELSEFQKSLSDNGFSFDGDGNVSNLNNRLKQLESWANSGDKENRQATVKNIQEMLEAYESLRDKISDTNSDILDINNSIIDAQKDISGIIKDQYEEWKEAEEKKTSKLKEEIQKRKDLMNKEWETEDYEDKLDSEQNKLNDLMSQRQDALRTGDKELIASLDKQISEQQKAISDLIRDQERDNANDKFDEVMDNLDKELEAKLEAMDKEMLDDVLLGKVQSGATSLSDIFGNINMASNDLNKNMLMVGDSISSWSDGLSNFITDLSSLSSIQIPLSINGSIQGAIGSLSASNPISISTVINLEGGTVISESEFETAIENNNKYIFKEINNIFKR